MKAMKRIAVILFAVMMAAGAAHAETLTLDGTVEAGVTIPVYAPIGGTVESVSVETGMHVAAGDTLFSYRTEKVYASEDGTVTGVFVTAGDDAEKATERYGADMYIEGKTLYSVNSSISNAYASVENKFVHTGERVYVVCRTDSSRRGVGIITGIDGSSYTVLVSEGSFIIGDSVAIYRDVAYSDKSRLGRGTIARVSPTAVTATGAVASVAVQDGDEVKRGDLLMETLNGTFDGYEMPGTDVTATEEGVVTSVTAEAGATVTQGDVVAQIAPISGMRIEAAISADERKSLKAGDKVSIELEADESKSYEGTVRYITELPEESESEETEEVKYKVIIDFTPDGSVFFGMAVVVNTEGQPAEAEAESEVTEPEEAEPAEAEEPAE